MEECEIITDKGETEESINFEPIIIQQNEKQYILNIETNEDKVKLYINDNKQFPSIIYKRTMRLKEIKELNYIFNILKSSYEFYDYLKQLSNNNKLNIKKSDDKITIIFYIEVLLKQQLCEIDLYPTKKDINLNIKELYQEISNMKDKNKEIDDLKIENQNLKRKIELIINDMNKITNENNDLKNKIDEIYSEMKLIKDENKKLNNEINNIKLYNAQSKLKIEEFNK